MQDYVERVVKAVVFESRIIIPNWSWSVILFPLGIIRCRCQLHGEIKEAFRLAVEKSIGHK
jgi:hypothetical protein